MANRQAGQVVDLQQGEGRRGYLDVRTGPGPNGCPGKFRLPGSKVARQADDVAGPKGNSQPRRKRMGRDKAGQVDGEDAAQ
jgi:hypothetical protein